MPSDNACGDPYSKPMLGAINYKFTASQLSNVKSWVSDNTNNMGSGNNCGICGGMGWGGCNCNIMTCPPYGASGSTYFNTTNTFNVTTTITKGKEKADILGDFFGPEVHALVILDETDGGARFVPFMDKLNMVWLQETLNSWAAYDREEFLAFANSEQIVFLGTKLNKAEVLKRMAKPENSPPKP
jgi:hypothetical protein